MQAHSQRGPGAWKGPMIGLPDIDINLFLSGGGGSFTDASYILASNINPYGLVGSSYLTWLNESASLRNYLGQKLLSASPFLFSFPFFYSIYVRLLA